MVSGTYAAYGQKLAIERGVINFTGAYDNPGLNIRAVRKRPEGEELSETNVEAGVEVRGTALAPVARELAAQAGLAREPAGQARVASKAARRIPPVAA